MARRVQREARRNGSDSRRSTGARTHATLATPAETATGPQSLQERIGNRATTRALQPRHADGTSPATISREISPADRAALAAAETALDTVSSDCAGQSASFGSLSDTALDHVNAARTHLGQTNSAYEAGHNDFTAVLKRADKEYEFDKSVEDAVQGFFIAAALAVVAPEALLVTGALRGAAASTNATLRAAGLSGQAAREAADSALVSGMRGAEGAVGESLEMLGGAGVDASKRDDPGRPSDSAEGAGQTPGDKFKEAFGQLDALVGAMPRLGSFTSATGAIARAAEQLAREAVKVRNGETAKFSAEEITRKTAQLKGLRDQAATSLQRADSLAASVRVMSQQITAKAVPAKSEIEDRLWTAWMAGLGSQHDMLDNDVLEEYLGPNGKKFFDFGSYTSDSDELDAVSSARARFLQQNGIELGPNTHTQYLAEMTLRRVKAAVIGKRGVISGRNTVVIDDKTYTYAQNAGVLEVGTPVVALHAVAPWSLAHGDVAVAEVRDSDIEVYCNRLDDMPTPSQQPEPIPTP